MHRRRRAQLIVALTAAAVLSTFLTPHRPDSGPDPVMPLISGTLASGRFDVGFGSTSPSAAIRRAAAKMTAEGPGAPDLIAEVAIVWRDSQRPALGIGVELWAFGGPTPLRQDAITDARGIARFVGVPAGLAVVELDRAGSSRHEIAHRGVTRIQRELDPACCIVGRVEDGAGNAIGGARLWLSSGDRPPIGEAVACTAADGTFRIEGIEDTRALWATAEGRAQTFPVDVTAKEAEPIVLVMAAPGFAVVGSVVDALGRRVSGAAIRLEAPPEPAPPDATGVSGLPRSARSMRTDAEGAFRFESVPAGRGILRVAQDRGVHAHLVYTSAAGAEPVRITLPEPGRLRGRVLDARGAPVALATVVVGLDDSDPFTSRRTATDERGAFEFVAVEPGPQSLSVCAGGASLCARSRVDANATTEITLNLPDPTASTVSIRVLGPRGEPLPEARVSLVAGERGRWRRRGIADAAGLASFDGVPYGKLGVDLGLTRISDFDLAHREITCPTPGVVDLAITAAEWGSGSLRARLLDAAGRAIGGARASLSTPRLSTQPTTRTGADGVLRFERLPLGAYTLEVSAPGRAAVTVAGLLIAAGQDTDLGELRID